MDDLESNSSFVHFDDKYTCPMQSWKMARVESVLDSVTRVKCIPTRVTSVCCSSRRMTRVGCIAEGVTCGLYLSRDSELAGRLVGRSDKPNSATNKYSSGMCWHNTGMCLLKLRHTRHSLTKSKFKELFFST